MSERPYFGKYTHAHKHTLLLLHQTRSLCINDKKIDKNLKFCSHIT